jgi:hypothetical protein
VQLGKCVIRSLHTAHMPEHMQALLHDCLEQAAAAAAAGAAAAAAAAAVILH